MAITILDHDGQRYLALPTTSTFERGRVVCLVALMPETIATLRERVDLADRLLTVYELVSVGFADISAEWWPVTELVAEPIDEAGEIYAPDWTVEPEHTEHDVLEVTEQAVEWHATPVDSDEQWTATLWRDDMEEL